MHMHWYHALILGIVEGITEFLPVSSTGHLIIASAMMGLDDDPNRKAAVDAYSIVIQAFALLAIVGLYFPRCWQMLKGLFGFDPAGQRLLVHLLLAFIPILILGPLLHERIMEHLFRPVPVLLALALGGIWMIWLGRRGPSAAKSDEPTSAPSGGELHDMTWKQAVGIGLFQCVSLWPGTSRAMMTIAGGTMLGLKPTRSAEFSFLLGLPTIGGAMVYQLAKDFFVEKDVETLHMIDVLGWTPILVGCVSTVVFAALAVKWLVAFLERHGLAIFGWYRIALCLAMISMLGTGFITLN